MWVKERFFLLVTQMVMAVLGSGSNGFVMVFALFYAVNMGFA